MIPQVLWFWFTIPLIATYRINMIKDMTEFRTYAQEQQCNHDTLLAEVKPSGAIKCFTTCLQLASCSHVRFHPKALVCRISMASKSVPSGKPKNSQSDEDWICWKKTHLAQGSCSECPPRSTCVKSRSGETKCVHDEVHRKLPKKEIISAQPQSLHITKRDFEENWKTFSSQEFRKHRVISFTWSPTIANTFYGLTYLGGSEVIVTYILQTNNHEKQSTTRLITSSSHSTVKITWTTLDTGQCMKNTNMLCIYQFGVSSTRKLHLRAFLETDKRPIALIVEKEGSVIEGNYGLKASSYLFVCNRIFGMAVYIPTISTTQKYLIKESQDGFTLKETPTNWSITWLEHIKWNKAGSFAFACSHTDIFMIRYVNEIERELFKVFKFLSGELTCAWSDASLYVIPRSMVKEWHVYNFTAKHHVDDDTV